MDVPRNIEQSIIQAETPLRKQFIAINVNSCLGRGLRILSFAGFLCVFLLMWLFFWVIVIPVPIY